MSNNLGDLGDHKGMMSNDLEMGVMQVMPGEREEHSSEAMHGEEKR